MCSSDLSSNNNDKSESNVGAEQMWLVVADTGGNKLFDKTFFTPGHDEDGLVVEMNPGSYIGAINSSCSIGGYKWTDSLAMGDVWICALTPVVNGVEDTQLENTISVYPNPLVKDVLTIKSNDQINWVELFNSDNKLMFSRSEVENTNTLKLSFTNYPNGIYFLKLGIADQTVVKKLIVINN